MTWEQTAEVLAREVDRLQKENDRLRYGIEQMLSHAGQCEGVTNIMAVMARIEWIEGIGKELLSPALEWGGAANGGESKPLACHEMTAEETEEAAEIIRKAWEGVPKNIPIGGFEGLESVAKAIVGGESQALQAAILGLHTLAGEFPTAMFKTREDYLQATISEINEIIGKQ